ncbi:MAG: hypothetical protein ABR611_01290 [Chthoniobacterales bacterium]
MAVLVAAAFAFWPRNPGTPFLFEVTIRSSLPGFAQLYYDLGAGFNEGNSWRVPIEGRDREVRCQFPLPAGIYAKFRFDPTDRSNNSMTLSGARIVDRDGRLFRTVAPSQFKAVNEIESLSANDQQVTFTTAATSHDPILSLELGGPVALKSFGQPSFRTLLRRLLIAFVVTAVLVAGTAPFLVTAITKARPMISRWLALAMAWGVAHPRQLLLLSAAVSVILSCYPIVFFGRSFLSPNNHSHTFLLYGEMPTVPGSGQVITDDEKGSDLGASMWYSWPISVAESRALLKDHELPLWNRYDSGGLPLLGQGQSMFGDPLHWLVLLTNGAAGWWDLKYLLAKFLFAAALAFCVLQLTRHLPSAVIIAFSASFIGFFSYRYSHPAFFSLCYAPLIYLAWVNLVTAQDSRRISFWLAFMVIANWTVMNSGTVKEAYVLLPAMNFCGCLTLLLSDTSKRIKKLGLALVAQFLFILMAAPIWMTFLHTLRNSWTVYDAGGAFQIQPGLLIGLFDDIFYRQFNADEIHLDPSANFLVLAAVLWFCLSPSRAEGMRRSWGPAITCLLALLVVFGIVPPGLIARLPFIGRIYHVDNVFSDVAIVCLLLLAAFGLRAFWSDCGTIRFKQIALRVFVALACLIALYLGTTEAAQRSTRTFLPLGGHIPKSAFFWGYSSSIVLGLVVAVWVGRAAVVHSFRARQAVLLGAAFVLLHWRHGMHLHTPFDSYVMNPQPRTDLIAASSPAVKLISSTSQNPSRTAGLGYDFAPGYGGAIGLEQIDSADPLLNRYYKSLIDNFGAKLLFGSSQSATIDVAKDHRLLDLLNVRYFLGQTGIKTDALSPLERIASLDLDVYESSQVWPRAFFTDRYVRYDQEKDFVDLVRSGNGIPFAAIASSDLAEENDLRALPDQIASPQPGAIVPAVDYRLTSNTTSFKVSAPGPGLVVLTEPYISDDFKVHVNGQPNGYFRVNGAFKGVVLPEAGSYTITYSYWPANFTFSLCLAVAGLAALIPLLFFAARTEHPFRHD